MELVADSADPADQRLHHSCASVNVADSASRRESKAGTALRRASAVLGKLLTTPRSAEDSDYLGQDRETQQTSRYDGGLSTILSGLYCKTLVLLGLVLPITEVLTEVISPSYYQVFYIYLCSAGLLFMVWVYFSVVRYRTVLRILSSYRREMQLRHATSNHRYGSFYLRLGAIGFGVGSMVYCGLEFGELLEAREKAECRQWNALIVPLSRMTLTIAQIQFIFLNSQNIDMCRQRVVCKFGLMHLVATNICEWLSIIAQETKHEITHFRNSHNYTDFETKGNNSGRREDCGGGSVMGSLVEDAAPVLYPCTIEYSLICAVIMYQMWRDMGARQHPAFLVRQSHVETCSSRSGQNVPSDVLILDCANANKGLLAGTGVIILTSASLILYLLSSGRQYLHALEAVDTWELMLHILSLVTVILASLKLKGATYHDRKGVMCLDTWLLMIGECGVTLHCLFKMTAVWVAGEGTLGGQLAALAQALVQTVFIAHFCGRRARGSAKPARQLITFLLLCNAGLWSINTLVRNKIASDEGSLRFYGPWGWIAMSRIAMPLSIFYSAHMFFLVLAAMWKHDEVLPSSKRGSVSSFANNIELATIKEKERENQELQPNLEPNIKEIPLLGKVKKTKIGLGSNTSLALTYKNIRKGRSYSLPFIQRNAPFRRSESTVIQMDTMTTVLSAMYCNILAILGVVFPIVEFFSSAPSSPYYQIYHLYLYTVSLLYLGIVYSRLLKQRTVDTVIKKEVGESCEAQTLSVDKPTNRLHLRYGSFYLRMGAIGFGIASIVYTGLELGQYFELTGALNCSHLLIAVTPATRMAFIVIQLQFIFVSNKQKILTNFRLISKFGLMHMIGANVCVWMSALVQETRLEILGYSNLSIVTVRTPIYSRALAELDLVSKLANHSAMNRSAASIGRALLLRPQELLECRKANIMSRLSNTAAPFLYPCIVEYTLICTVILYALWNNICGKNQLLRHNSAYGNKSPKPINGYTSQHFTVDCANSHKGLFASILVLVVTIISLIMFLVLIKEKEYRRAAEFQVNLWELMLYTLCTLSTVLAMFNIRKLKYEPNRHLELDTVLLMLAQTGLYIYFAFSLLAGYLTQQIFKQPVVFLTSLVGLIQSSLQTLFIVDAWWRKCSTPQIAIAKPGRQLITFLLLSNIAMWAINHLENARPDLHPMELDFYGVWTWTIITHISMPLAVFYRFHSSVCFCEIWKSAYKSVTRDNCDQTNH
ncbi:uncharacterized protein [Rhodnius prolixus]|uniref:uncharacterized protein n=1 Tax=Rhodnius prolixus TaxID=13249 RepID=UPI003D18A3BF